jgi:uncharacterized membrane protein
MDLGALLETFEHSSLAGAMKYSLWLYPIVEIVHIAGFALLVGTVAAFDLRLLGFARSTSIRALERSLLPWTWAALLLIVPSGIAMFSTHAMDFANNPAFRVKLVLLLAAALNALLFHVGVFRSVAAWDQHVAAPRAANLSALLSLAIWTGVISCGRLIAYL